MATPVVYDQFKLKQHNSGTGINLATDTIKVMLITATTAPAQANAFISDINTNQVTGTNYVAGGTAISTVTCTLSTDTVIWNHASITWLQNAAGFSTARYAIWYKDTGLATTSPVIMYMDLGSNVGNVAGDLVLSVNAGTGVLNIV